MGLVRFWWHSVFPNPACFSCVPDKRIFLNWDCFRSIYLLLILFLWIKRAFKIKALFQKLEKGPFMKSSIELKREENAETRYLFEPLLLTLFFFFLNKNYKITSFFVWLALTLKSVLWSVLCLPSFLPSFRNPLIPLLSTWGTTNTKTNNRICILLLLKKTCASQIKRKWQKKNG